LSEKFWDCLPLVTDQLPTSLQSDWQKAKDQVPFVSYWDWVQAIRRLVSSLLDFHQCIVLVISGKSIEIRVNFQHVLELHQLKKKSSTPLLSVYGMEEGI